MDYNKIQFIGFSIYVGGKQKDKSVQQYYPGLANMDQDITARLKIMKDAATLARNMTQKLDTSPKTLKVFVAPEFFFRGKTGAYSMQGYDKVLAGLKEIAKDSKFANWLFVFGTTIAESELTSPNKEVYNIAVVQPGGTDSGTKVVMKEAKSPKDFLVNPADANALDDRNVSHAAPFKASGTGMEKQGRDFDGLGIFEYGGICFGLEICVDHHDKRLRKSAVACGEARVQVQIVPSAGINLKPMSVIAIKNGVAFNCDGLYGTGSGYHPDGIKAHTDLAVVTKMSSGSTGAATLKHITLNEHVNVPLTTMPKDLFFQDKAQLHFYPAQTLPQPSTRSNYKFWKDYK